MKYIAKTNTWFDEESVAELIDDYRPQLHSGLFRGWHEGRLDEEVCLFDEFDAIDNDDFAVGGMVAA